VRDHRGFLFFLKKFSVCSLFLVCVCCGVWQAACGRKGPPLAPIVYVPRAVGEFSAKRTEDDVVLRFRIPTVNTDNSSPANLRRVEVYAHTGPLPSTADYLKYGTLIASIDVKEPETPKSDQAGTASDGRSAAAPDAAGTTDAAGGAASMAPTEVAGESPAGAAAPERGAPAVQADGNAAGGSSAQTLSTAGSVLLEQGWTTTVRETLTDKHREIGPMPPTRPLPAVPAGTKIETLETPGTVNFELTSTRYYTVVGVSRNRNRRGPFAPPIRVPLIEPSSAPEKVDVSYTADAIALLWPARPEDVTPAAQTPPTPAAPGVYRLETEDTVDLYSDVETEGTQNPPSPPLASKPPPAPVARFGYNVYEVDGSTHTDGPGTAARPDEAPDTEAQPKVHEVLRVTGGTESTIATKGSSSKEDLTAEERTARVAPPVAPLNASLITAPTFNDPRVEFGTERCYVVRRVEMAGAIAIESAPSAPVCVTPVDKFPPAPPKNLAHIASASGVSLLWEPNREADLGGYLVLRGEAPGDKLAPLTPEPITNTSFTDTSVRRGRTYVYEVVALDKSAPANQSGPSNRVEETIR
jgi:hypothetical protein